MASHPGSNPPDVSRRAFLKTAAAAAASAPFSGVLSAQQSGAAPLMAYVGTFSSPLRDVLPTQVDLPPGYAGSNFCSEILVSADGRFVYGGNGLHDSIGIFAVGRTGELTFTGYEWTRGNYPRSFGFDPTGRFLYCCNQRADNVTVFRADAKTGSLAFTGRYTPAGNPSSIVFTDLATAG